MLIEYISEKLLFLFSRVPFGIKDKDKLKSHGTIFTPIPVRIVTYDEEKSASR